jgi:O-antigen/teichoic acid export membrane protein
MQGSFWLFGGRIFRQALFLARAVILGRLLTPRDFGMVGAGELAIMLLGVLTYTGFNEALVQRPSLTARVLHTAWWVNLIRAGVMAATLWLAAPCLAAPLDPAVTPVLRALALVQFISGLTSVGVTLLHKDMQFRQLFGLEAWGLAADLAVAVAAALLWGNVWALVLGAAAGAATRVTLSYVRYPVPLRFVFDAAAARELFGFGRWLLCSGLLYFFMARGAEAVGGYLFGVAALGLYQMAARFALSPMSQFGEVFFQAVFPAYSQIQEEPRQLLGAFLKVLQVATLIIFPLSTLLVVLIGPLLPRLLGAQWQGAAALVPGLAMGGALQALLRTGPPLFMATGRPSYQFAVDLGAALGIVLCLYPLAWGYGLPGLTWAYAAGICLGLPLWWRGVRRQSRAAPQDLLISVVPALAASLVLAAAIRLPARLFAVHLGPGTSLGWLTGLGLAGVAAYILTILLFERRLPNYQPLRATFGLIVAQFKQVKT